MWLLKSSRLTDSDLWALRCLRYGVALSVWDTPCWRKTSSWKSLRKRWTTLLFDFRGRTLKWLKNEFTFNGRAKNGKPGSRRSSVEVAVGSGRAALQHMTLGVGVGHVPLRRSRKHLKVGGWMTAAGASASLDAEPPPFFARSTATSTATICWEWLTGKWRARHWQFLPLHKIVDVQMIYVQLALYSAARFFSWRPLPLRFKLEYWASANTTLFKTRHLPFKRYTRFISPESAV